jgi:hypothetical protein
MRKTENIPAPEPARAGTLYRAVTFRVPPEHLDVLTALAIVDDDLSPICVADELRGAVASYAVRRLADPDLPSRVEAVGRLAAEPEG